MKYLFLLSIVLFTIGPMQAEPALENLAPLPKLWITNAEISMQAVYLASPGAGNFPQPNTVAAIRVYLCNHAHLPIKYLGTNIDDGFEITKVGADGKMSNFRHESEVTELIGFRLKPGRIYPFTIYISEADLPFFIGSNFQVKAQFAGLSTMKKINMEVPLNRDF